VEPVVEDTVRIANDSLAVNRNSSHSARVSAVSASIANGISTCALVASIISLHFAATRKSKDAINPIVGGLDGYAAPGRKPLPILLTKLLWGMRRLLGQEMRGRTIWKTKRATMLPALTAKVPNLPSLSRTHQIRLRLTRHMSWTRWGTILLNARLEVTRGKGTRVSLEI
jgi:hypothetical protein